MSERHLKSFEDLLSLHGAVFMFVSYHMCENSIEFYDGLAKEMPKEARSVIDANWAGELEALRSTSAGWIYFG